MSSGILNLDKPKGMTSHDVIRQVRRVTGIRKVGHSGTLDPMATGVLLVCVGRATRLTEYMLSGDKSYRAVVRLGVETDTYDADGRVISSRPVGISREEVEAALHEFSGSIDQVPPMYSAIKHKGRPLYAIARRGLTVEREPRQVRISRVTMVGWSPPEFTFEVVCSAGTYVRSLAHDLGQRLGCGAHLTGLVRCRSGRFELEDAIPLRELAPDNWKRHLQPMDAAVGDLPILMLSHGAAQQLIQGQSIPWRPEHPVAKLARAHTENGGFFAIVRPSEDGTRWSPHKVFVE
jgi:tRNA pseudouridine55 synthase